MVILNVMKHLLLLCLLMLLVQFGRAQKPVIDSAVYGKWPRVFNPAISNDGHYIMYNLNNRPVKSHTLVIESVDLDWRREIPGGNWRGMTQDSRMAVYMKPGDTLCIVRLGSDSIENITDVSSFKFPKRKFGGWCAYRLKNKSSDLIVRNLTSGKQQSFSSVKDYFFSDSGNALVIWAMRDDVESDSLIWDDLLQDKKYTIWSGAQVGRVVFDRSGRQIVFTTEEKKDNDAGKSIWYYAYGANRANLLCGAASTELEDGLIIGDIGTFSKDGTRIFFNLKERDLAKPSPEAVQVDIWSYKDTKLQSQQLKELSPHSYAAALNIDDKKIIRLQRENEFSNSMEFMSPDHYYVENADDFIVMYQHKDNLGQGEVNWNPASQTTVYLENTRNGERKNFRKVDLGIELTPAFLSPEGKYIVYYDCKQRNYFSYNVSSGIVRNITKGIGTSFTILDDDIPRGPFLPIPIAGWLKEDKAVLLYDKNDIWKADPLGNAAPVNITNGYGRKHGIVFRLGLAEYSIRSIREHEKILLTAFNRNNKDNGFFIKAIDRNGDPEMLTMGSYVYNIPHISVGAAPFRAKDTSAYLVYRESITEAPNYFYTRDLKSYRPLSDVHPEKDFNWLAGELVSWRMPDGKIAQGILYRPENFDAHRRYPMIISYYDKLADRMNVYLAPGPTHEEINIPQYVSQGYLVFTPDLHYNIGHVGEGVLNTVVSAVKHLSKYPWINLGKIGIDGHSFGGYETEYLITHTSLFAAACATSAVCDLIGSYGSLWEDGSSQQEYSELRAARMGATLWAKPDQYIKNSPIFQADKVTTPLLMMNNKKDPYVSFSQGVEFFTALRRLRKRVWMLQYDDGGHSVGDRSQTDYSIRIAQFFDHYLKDFPAPLWMTKGIPARKKGIENGLGIDSSNMEP